MNKQNTITRKQLAQDIEQGIIPSEDPIITEEVVHNFNKNILGRAAGVIVFIAAIALLVFEVIPGIMTIANLGYFNIGLQLGYIITEIVLLYFGSKLIVGGAE